MKNLWQICLVCVKSGDLLERWRGTLSLVTVDIVDDVGEL